MQKIAQSGHTDSNREMVIIKGQRDVGKTILCKMGQWYDCKERVRDSNEDGKRKTEKSERSI